ncbi:MAG: hypothetical protein AAGF89_04410 [Bacteroidota bacterium]
MGFCLNQLLLPHGAHIMGAVAGASSKVEEPGNDDFAYFTPERHLRSCARLIDYLAPVTIE